MFAEPKKQADKMRRICTENMYPRFQMVWIILMGDSEESGKENQVKNMGKIAMTNVRTDANQLLVTLAADQIIGTINAGQRIKNGIIARKWYIMKDVTEVTPTKEIAKRIT